MLKSSCVPWPGPAVWKLAVPAVIRPYRGGWLIFIRARCVWYGTLKISRPGLRECERGRAHPAPVTARRLARRCLSPYSFTTYASGSSSQAGDENLPGINTGNPVHGMLMALSSAAGACRCRRGSRSVGQVLGGVINEYTRTA
jgi:hypothetical protein